MNTDFEQKLQRQISLYKVRMLEIEPHLNESEYLNDVYNKLVIKKAVMLKTLKDVKNKPSVWQKFEHAISFKKREKLICDYFKYPC